LTGTVASRILVACLLLLAAGTGRARGDDLPDKNEEPAKPLERIRVDSRSYLPEEAMPLDRDHVPSVRTAPLLEIGDPFQGQGEIGAGYELPTGAVWNPSLLFFGVYRSALQLQNPGTADRSQRVLDGDVAEWAQRLDLFANLRLSPTERVLVGMRPLDDGKGDTSDYDLEPNGTRGWKDRTNARLRTAFFEGDVGEIFPGLDRSDQKQLDIGFSIGRQPISFQDGVMINGVIDAIGVTKNSLKLGDFANLRLTALYGIPDLLDTAPFGERANGSPSRRDLAGFFAELENAFTTVQVDAMYVNPRTRAGQSVLFGVGATQRLGAFNTTLRYNVSAPLHEETGNGQLLTGELSYTLPWANDLVYADAYLGVDRYVSAFRDADAGGPVGRIGILFTPPAIGRYAAPLSAVPDRSAGGVLGFQGFWNDARTQLVVEFGGRHSTQEHAHDGAIALGARLQQAVLERVLLVAEAYAGKAEGRRESFGSRVEVDVKF
jgi:hypothetical protein